MNIFFFGDSICSGQGVSVHKTWVTRISQNLENLEKKYKIPITVTNSSINGNTTRQALERIHYDVLSHGVDIILIQFGMNDCNYWSTDKGLPRISKQAFKSNLLEIIEKVEKHGAKKMIINTNHPTGRSKKYSFAEISYQKSNEEYNDIIRWVVGQKKAVLLNDIEKYFFLYMRGNDEDIYTFLLKDNLHLGIKGHDLYLLKTYPLIEKEVIQIIKRKWA